MENKETNHFSVSFIWQYSEEPVYVMEDSE